MIVYKSFSLLIPKECKSTDSTQSESIKPDCIQSKEEYNDLILNLWLHGMHGNLENLNKKITTEDRTNN